MNSKLRIVLLGYLVRGPLGGMAWHHLQYMLGLAGLGHEVYFLEDSDDYPSCYDPQRHVTDTDPSYGLEFARQAFAYIGMPQRWAYYDAHAEQWHGPCAGKVHEFNATAELLLNLSGVNPLRPWLAGIRHRVLVDTDPVFTQIRHLSDPGASERASDHTAFFTFAENIFGEDCSIPDDGLPWRPTRQPIVLGAWPHTAARLQGPYTTVMQWDSYESVEYRGQRFGMKSASFQPLLDLPYQTGARLELALGSEQAPRELLSAKGWRLKDPLKVSRSLQSYQRYLQESKAEFSVAKQGYVAARSGWFSERSACYLAAGRPVIVQDTGFTGHIETGTGILAFASPEEAQSNIEEMEANYRIHCSCARDVARCYFDANTVLERMIEKIFN
jgi:hypothetical protein